MKRAEHDQAHFTLNKSNIRFKAEDAAEQAVMQRFENLVENLRKGWQDEEREHLEQQERRLRTHYETILKHSHNDTIFIFTKLERRYGYLI